MRGKTLISCTASLLVDRVGSWELREFPAPYVVLTVRTHLLLVGHDDVGSLSSYAGIATRE